MPRATLFLILLGTGLLLLVQSVRLMAQPSACNPSGQTGNTTFTTTTACTQTVQCGSGPPLITYGAVVSTAYIGPATIMVGDCMSQTCVIAPGGIDIDTVTNVNTTTFQPCSLQVKYVTHLDIGDSKINISNDGQNSIAYSQTSSLATGDGNLCVGVYTFDANEELQSCCSCLVTPNGLASLSAQAINATSLTGENPTSLVVKLLAWSTTAGASSTAPPGTPAPPTSSSCNAATPGTLAGGMHAWGTTLHPLPSGGPSTYTVTETEFSPANLSAAEYAHITQSCEFNQINGSAQSGQCKGCASGGQ